MGSFYIRLFRYDYTNEIIIYHYIDRYYIVLIFSVNVPDCYEGELPVMTEAEVKECVNKARIAQSQWKKSSFQTRRLLMRTMLKYITENQENCARVAVRESGKTMLDALIGEILVTCEKLVWLINYGEGYLKPEVRESGRLMMMKRASIEYIPLG